MVRPWLWSRCASLRNLDAAAAADKGSIGIGAAAPGLAVEFRSCQQGLWSYYQRCPGPSPRAAAATTPGAVTL